MARRLTNFVYPVYISGMSLGSGGDDPGRRAFGGAGGNAGEFGRTTAVPGGHGCIYGKNGCLEDLCLGRFRDAPSRGPRDRRGFDGRLRGGIRAKHPAVAAWIAAALEPLRVGLNTIENLFDPETIMLGGTAPAWLIDALVAGVHPLYPSVGRHNRVIPRLTKAELGRDSVVRGAAVLPVLSRLNPQYQQLNPFG